MPCMLGHSQESLVSWCDPVMGQLVGAVTVPITVVEMTLSLEVSKRDSPGGEG